MKTDVLGLAWRCSLRFLSAATRWAFTRSRAFSLHATQRQMLSIILRLRILPGETPESFVRRRGRACSEMQAHTGTWSKDWARDITSWSEHLRRSRNHNTWAAMVSEILPPEELQRRRALHSSPHTRNASGFTFKKWFESVQDAKTYMSCSSPPHPSPCT